ncbi:glycosyltransferase family 92 protein [bacterium]|nr:glycosyltransferase family 92 protein [bacterium]
MKKLNKNLNLPRGGVKQPLLKLICAFVPSKGLRYAIREGLIKEYFKAKSQIKKDIKLEPTRTFKHFLTLTAICKNEAPYLPEWIEYHKMLGVEKFYIYDNESTDNTKEVLKSYIADGTVEYTYWEGKAQQGITYDDSVAKHKYETKWMAFIDIDEFIVPLSKETIPDIINNINPKTGLSIHWLIYGDNGHKTKTDGLVIERFTKHSTKNFYRNRWIKSIVNPRLVFKMRAHNGEFIGNNLAVDENGKKLSGHSKHISHNKIRINHYWGKSYEEFQIKKSRPSAACGLSNTHNDKEFEYYNRNDIEDKTTMQKYIKPIKENLKKRGLI